MANPTITNNKTSFDASSNADYTQKTSTVGGAHIQHVFQHLPSITQSSPGVTTSDGQILAANAARLPGGWIENNTSTDVWIGIGTTAVVNQGTKLRANGGVLLINCVNEIRGIVSSGSITIYAFEPTHTNT